ncbi:MAG: hypothetical protein KC546_02935, partial [Anaerolineae bacterium]|nr:hypothetical protein [Anaerolineae bacterium]
CGLFRFLPDIGWLLPCQAVNGDASGIQRPNMHITIFLAQLDGLAFMKWHVALIAEDPGMAGFNIQQPIALR